MCACVCGGGGGGCTCMVLRPTREGGLGVWEHAAGAVISGVEALAPRLVDFSGQDGPGGGEPP